jgi:hypothetical protein
VAIEHAIEALRRDVADVAGRLSPGQLRELLALLDEAEGPDPDAAMSRFADLIEETLPADHAVVRALYEGDLSGPARLDVPRPAITRQLRAEIEAALAVVQERGPEPRPGEAILRSVADRVLRAPAFSADQVRERGGDPADPGLIRLATAGGRPQWPSFQFSGPRGGPLPVVRAVNDLLDAAADPVAAADWWLSWNTWLGSAPSALLGQAPDEYLIRAARVIGSEG